MFAQLLCNKQFHTRPRLQDLLAPIHMHQEVRPDACAPGCRTGTRVMRSELPT